MKRLLPVSLAARPERV